MTYEIEWEASARRELRKLDPPVRRRLAIAITALAGDPRPASSTEMAGHPAGTMRMRVGDYRVVYVIEDDRVCIVVVRVGHRGAVHRDLWRAARPHICC